MRRLAAAMISAVAFAGPAQAQIVIDQNQDNAVGFFGLMNAWNSQSLAGTASNLAGAGLYLAGINAGSHAVTIMLWDQVASNVGATILATGTTVASFPGSFQPQWVDVFWDAVAIAPGSNPYITAIASDGVVTLYANDPYAGGEAGYNFSPDPTAPYSGSTRDLTFRTYTDLDFGDGGGGGSGTATPESLTMVLMGSGLAGIAAVRRRRAA